MHSYEFYIKGDVVGFRSSEEEYILIDKDDMQHVLSASGQWSFEKKGVMLQNNIRKEPLSLAQYILSQNCSKIRHINGNPLDFRKQNLLHTFHHFSPYFIRPLSNKDISTFIPQYHQQFSQKFFTIRMNHKIVGYISIIPLSYKFYKKFLNEKLERKQVLTLSSSYENDSNYYHVFYGEFPNDVHLIDYLLEFYTFFLHCLKFRNIHIGEACFLSNDTSYLLGKPLKAISNGWNMFGTHDDLKLQINLQNLEDNLF